MPDGLTVYRNGVREAIVGYEVDLNLKNEERYQSTMEYYTEGVAAHLVIWLVKNAWVAERIVAALRGSYSNESAEIFLSKIAFVELDSFKARTWNAVAFYGKFKGISISKLHANLWQSIGKTQANRVQNDPTKFFFPKHKSPQKSLAYTKQPSSEICKHPMGAGAILHSQSEPESHNAEQVMPDHSKTEVNRS